jgi:hypothetical protein
MNRNRVSMAARIGVVGEALLVAASAVAAPPHRPCYKGYCLDVWRPVICSNGQVYSNDCYAARACQYGCVPWGGDTE